MWILPAMQLAANLSFSPITFGHHDLLASVVVVMLTLVLAVLTTMQYGLINKSRIAALLMVPYVAWLVFAAVLSFKIYKLNKKKVTSFV
jgi:translocator protein